MEQDSRTLGERLSDAVANTVGSWGFIAIQSAILTAWVVANVVGWVTFDIYPFILLNLFLSFQAAYTAPFILMSQSRQSAKDRLTIESDLASDQRAEQLLDVLVQRVEELHEKMDSK